MSTFDPAALECLAAVRPLAAVRVFSPTPASRFEIVPMTPSM